MPRSRRSVRFAASMGGYVFSALVLYSLIAIGGWSWPGADAYTWDRVGDAVRSGADPYWRPDATHGFFYTPPWALALATVTWLPVPVVNLLIGIAEVLALRYVAGSWLRVGYLAWCPLVALELVGAQWNLVMAAAIAAAIRGDVRPAVVMASAKLSPALAIDPRRWRTALASGFVLVAVTLPWLGLWSAWLAADMSVLGVDISPGAMLPLPWFPRLAVALALLVIAWWRDWPRMRALAAILATPALYWVSGTLLFALLPRGASPTTVAASDRFFAPTGLHRLGQAISRSGAGSPG